MYKREWITECSLKVTTKIETQQDLCVQIPGLSVQHSFGGWREIPLKARIGKVAQALLPTLKKGSSFYD